MNYSWNKMIFLVVMLSFCGSTHAQVELVKDANTIKDGIDQFPFIAESGGLYYLGVKDEKGYELWRTDGTPDGTFRVTDLYKGGASGISIFIRTTGVDFNGKLLFVGQDNEREEGIFITDGTEQGTKVLKKFPVTTPGFWNNGNGSLTTYKDKGYFFVGSTLWSTDGTPENTLPVLTRPGNPIDYQLTKTEEYLFFSTYGNSTAELYRSDGTEAGTIKLFSFKSSLAIGGLTVVGNKLFCAGGNGLEQFPTPELLVTDGTPEGTRSLKKGFVRSFKKAGGKFFFCIGREIWTSDGTVSGTFLIYSHSENAFINPIEFKGKILIVLGKILLETDGTAANTHVANDITFNANLIHGEAVTVFNNQLVYETFTTQTGYELGISDGSAEGTLIKDLNPGTPSSSPRSFKRYKDKLIFTATDDPHARELWITDGNDAALLKDMKPGTLGSTYLTQLYTTSNGIYFSADDFKNIWFTNGEETTHSIGLTGDYPSTGIAGDDLYFFEDTRLGVIKAPNREIITLKSFTYSQQGYVSGVPQKLAVTTLLPLVTFNSTYINDPFNLGQEFWISDGTDTGTKILKDLNPGNKSGITGVSAAIADTKLLFAGNEGINGIELWITDGTEANTKLVTDINPGSASSNPTEMITVNGIVFFVANDGVHGYELWRTDGTLQGTLLIKDIVQGPQGSSPEKLTKVGSQVFFCMRDPILGWTLWRSDGSDAGTKLVKDLNPSSAEGEAPHTLVEVNGKLFFASDNGIQGMELWVSDGTIHGTIINEIVEGPEGSNPGPIINVAGLAYFKADGKLWKGNGKLFEEVSDLTPVSITSYHNYVYFMSNSTAYGCELFRVPHTELSITGVHSPENNVTYFPNPVSDVLTVESESSGESEFELLKLTGQSLAVGSFLSHIEIPVSNYSPGVYILKVTSSKNIIVKKIYIR
jgi:trimeric autotransporter adhesin